MYACVYGRVRHHWPMRLSKDGWVVVEESQRRQGVAMILKLQKGKPLAATHTLGISACFISDDFRLFHDAGPTWAHSVIQLFKPLFGRALGHLTAGKKKRS